MFRVRFADGGELQLTEAGSKKRAGVWLLQPGRLARGTGAPRPRGGSADDRGRRAHPRVGLATPALAAARPAADRRDRARLGQRDPLGGTSSRPTRSPPRSTTAETERLAAAIHDELARGLELRLAGANDEKTYRVHNKLGVPCARCGTPIARVDFEEHTIYYCPQCQTEGRVLKDRRMSRLLK